MPLLVLAFILGTVCLMPVLSAGTHTKYARPVPLPSLHTRYVVHVDAQRQVNSMRDYLWTLYEATTTTTTSLPPLPSTTTTLPDLSTTTIPPTSTGSDATSVDTADWSCIRLHESGNRYNDPSAPSGAYGIEHVTADAYGLAWPVSSDTPADQDRVALELYARYGWQPWSTRIVCGL